MKFWWTTCRHRISVLSFAFFFPESFPSLSIRNTLLCYLSFPLKGEGRFIYHFRATPFFSPFRNSTRVIFYTDDVTRNCFWFEKFKLSRLKAPNRKEGVEKFVLQWLLRNSFAVVFRSLNNLHFFSSCCSPRLWNYKCNGCFICKRNLSTLLLNQIERLKAPTRTQCHN